MYVQSIVSLVLAIGIAEPMVAQAAQGTQAAHPFSLDVTIGPSMGWGGAFFGRVGAAAEITLVPDHETGRIFAFTVGGHGSPAGGDICALNPGPGPHCLPRFPAIAHAGVLTGLELVTSIVTLRAMAGPAYYYGGSSTSGLGGQLQLDAAAGFTHLALVVAARGGLIARFSGGTLRLGSLGLGMRLQ